MKTKEIEVWVQSKIIDGELSQIIGFSEAHAIARKISDPAYVSLLCGEKAIKARLIIELPEKKVEITESDLDYILRYVGCLTDGNIKAHLKQTLFGKEDK
jgi:hypothetical protein